MTKIKPLIKPLNEEIFPPERMAWTSCVTNCGACCPLRLFIRDQRIVRVESDNSGDEEGRTEIRSCLRGRAIRQLVYAPDRLRYPMKRIGKRGEGKFERISWNEAFGTIAASLRRVIANYGNEAVYRQYGYGTTSSTINRGTEFARLMNQLGGYLGQYGTYSNAQLVTAMHYTYGQRASNSASDTVNSRLVVMFGNNAVETRASGGGTSYDLLQARKKSDARWIFIDPRYSDTAALFADEWIAIRPGTDAALASAIAYVLISENLIDKPFLDSCCVGYDDDHLPEGIAPGNSYADYILGKGPDRLPKTPAWASGLTGCSAEVITRLAREIGEANPVYITQGYGPQRHACGEQSARAILALSIITGNIGIQGGNTGDMESAGGIPFPAFPTGSNPVKTMIPCFLWDKAIDNGPSMTALNAGVQGKEKLDTGIKFLWNSASNTTVNQHANINAAKKILADETKCEMIVVVETRLTPSAMFADFLLPSVYPAEEDEIFRQGYAMTLGSLLVAPRAVEPPGEAKTQYEICSGLAERLGIGDQYTEGRTQKAWMEYLYHESRKLKPELPENINEAIRHGIYKWYATSPLVALKAFRNNPRENPLSTPSGKIELFSRRLLDMGQSWELPDGDAITALPQYAHSWEGVHDPLRAQFPLQLIGHHFKGRVHSSFAGLAWLQKVAPQSLWINQLDAAKRGIRHGDMVKVFNGRGLTYVPAKVTLRIMPGVVSLPEGAWHKTNAEGEDIGGCVNVLTKDHSSPLAKGNPQHTNLVQVVKV